MKRPKEEWKEYGGMLIALFIYYIVMGALDHYSIFLILSATGFVGIILILIGDYIKKHSIKGWRFALVIIGYCLVVSIFLFQIYKATDAHISTTEKESTASTLSNK